MGLGNQFTTKMDLEYASNAFVPAFIGKFGKKRVFVELPADSVRPGLDLVSAYADTDCLRIGIWEIIEHPDGK